MVDIQVDVDYLKLLSFKLMHPWDQTILNRNNRYIN